MKEKNLIERIKDNKLKNFFNFNDDYTKIISSYDGKLKTILRENDKNGKKLDLPIVLEEELVRELIFQIQELKIFGKQYVLEEYTQDKKRTDLLHGNGTLKKLFNLIEVKTKNGLKSGNNFQRGVNDGFNQLESYIQQLTKTGYKYENTKNTFATFIVLDLELLLEKDGLNKFSNFLNTVNKFDDLSISKYLEKYGIYIETREYSVRNGKFTNLKSLKIPFTEQFQYHNNRKQNLTGYKKYAVSAYYTITSSSSVGVSNVRERLDLEKSFDKENLFFSILNTLVEGYLKKDYDILSKNSETKTFAFLDNQTHFEEYVQDNGVIDCYFTTLNGALINGQQSTHIPYLIKYYLETVEFLLTEKGKLIKDKILKNLIINNITSSRDEDSFIKYIENCYFDFKIEFCNTEEEIKSIAINKNTSIKVDIAENIFAEHGYRYKWLSNYIYEKTNYIFVYPNMNKTFIDENKIIMDIRDFIPIIKLFFDKRNNKTLYKALIEGKNYKPYKDFKKNSLSIIKSIVTEIKREKLQEEIDLENKIKENNIRIETYTDPRMSMNEEIKGSVEKLKNKNSQYREELRIFRERNVEGLKIHSSYMKNNNFIDNVVLKIINDLIDLNKIIDQKLIEYNKKEGFTNKSIFEKEQLVYLTLFILKYKNKNKSLIQLDIKKEGKKILDNLFKLTYQYSPIWTQLCNNLTDDGLKDIILKDNININTLPINGYDFFQKL